MLIFKNGLKSAIQHADDASNAPIYDAIVVRSVIVHGRPAKLRAIDDARGTDVADAAATAAEPK